MSLICRTFSLATLRNIFPDASSWKASGHGHSRVNPSARGAAASNQNASPYVQIYIGMYIGSIRMTWNYLKNYNYYYIKKISHITN